MDLNLEEEIYNNTEIALLCEDISFARELYSSLCNMRWKKTRDLSESDAIIERLKGNSLFSIWSCTWRHSGHVVATIRNTHYNMNEDYMTFYCSGDESEVSDRIRIIFRNMGWDPEPWDDDYV